MSQRQKLVLGATLLVVALWAAVTAGGIFLFPDMDSGTILAVGLVIALLLTAILVVSYVRENGAPSTDTPQPREETENQYNPAVGRTVIIVGCVAVFGLIAYMSSSDTDLSRADVRTYCEESVKLKLKNPSSADFDYPSAREIRTGEWEATGTFRAENSFGGTVQNSYTCTVEVDGNDIDVLTVIR